MPAGYIYSWTSIGVGNFGAAANWYNETGGSAATQAPGVNDEALIYSIGTLTGTGHVYELGLTGAGYGMVIGGQLAADNAFIAGAVAIASGASLTSDTIVDIGDDSATSIAQHTPGLLTVEAGGVLRGTLNETNAFDILVGQYGGTGTLAVQGPGALADAGSSGYWVGNQGTGTIAVGTGGQITAGTGAAQQIGLALGISGGSGSLSISGAGAGATFGNIAEIGFGGQGSVLVQQGGTLTAGDGSTSLSIGDAYDGAIGSGTVTLNGASATLRGVADIGTFGQGSLDLSNGATVTAGSTLTTGTASYWSVLLGASAGSSGTLSLSMSSFSAMHGLAVGSDGHGELDVTFSVLDIDAQAEAGSVALDAGLDSGSSGAVAIDYGVVQDLGHAGVIVGGGGTGTLAIADAGTLACGGTGGFGGLALGAETGASGSVSVAGTGSLLSCAGQVTVGTDGTGILSISGGASANLGVSPGSAGLVLGGGSGSGTATIETGARLSVLGQTEIGADGRGTLTLASGGTFTGNAGAIAALELGANAGSSGSVLITDAGTNVSLAGGLAVGGSGTGQLTLQDQAVLTLATGSPNLSPGFVLAANGGTSTALVTGAGTRLADTGQFLVGGQSTGTGSLTIADGAAVSVLAAPGQTVPGAVIAAGAGSGTSAVLVTGVDATAGLRSDWSVAGQLLVGHLSHGVLTVAAGAEVSAGSVAVSDYSGGHGTIVVTGQGSSLSTGALTLGGTSSTGSLLVQSGGLVSSTGSIQITGAASLGSGTLTAGGTLTIEKASSITGQGTVSAASIVDLGRLGLNAGTMTCIGTVTGTGQLGIGGGGHLLLEGAASTGVTFTGAGLLSLSSSSALTGGISGWTAGDVIDLRSTAATSASYSGHTLSLFDSGNHLLGTLSFAGTLAAHNFTIGADGAGGSLISFHS